MKRRLLALSIAALSIGYQTSHHARQTAAMEVIYPCSASGAPAASPAPSAIRALEGTAHGFEANQGQTGDRVRYLARGPSYTLFLAPDEFVLVLRDAAKSEGRIGKDAQGPRARSFRATRVVRMRLIGGNPKTRLVGDGEMSGRSNYLIGRDRNNWRRGIPRYARVRYEEVYPGVDLVFYGTEGQLEYDLVVAPGADAGVVRVALGGAAALRLEEEGTFLFTAGSGRFWQRPRLPTQALVGFGPLLP